MDAQNETQTTNNEQRTTDYRWLLGCFLITATATFLRFWQLTLKPLHHDEGVNGFFLTTLFRDGVYKYDPTNYHGPTLYYIALFFSNVFGLETWSVRASVAIFGVLMVVLVFFLKDYLGKIGSLAAALFLALSPGMVFISRYFIHEIFFVFLSLAIVVSVLFFLEKRKAGIFAIGWTALILFVCFVPSSLNLADLIGGANTNFIWALRVAFFLIEALLIFFILRMLLSWDEGRPIYLILASASIVLLFATKETAFITLGTMIIACFCVWLWRKIYRGAGLKTGEDDLAPTELTWTHFREKLGDNTNLLLILAAAGAVFVYVGVLFFSSFFTYAEGVSGAFEAYTAWTKTGSKDHTQNGFLAYAKWLFKIESPILILAAVGTLLALMKAKHRFAIFTGFWAFGLFLAYTIIPYKTPWLALSFILPMCLIAGYGINELATARDVLLKLIAGLLAVVSVGILAFQTYDLNFVRYDDDSMPYVYAHTRRGYLDLIGKIEYYAEKSGEGKEAAVEIVSPDYWAMPWDLRNYQHANFHGRIVPANSAEMIVAKKGDQNNQVLREYSAHYKYAGEFPLRPGVDLILLVRRDLADPDTQELYRINKSASAPVIPPP